MLTWVLTGDGMLARVLELKRLDEGATLQAWV
jgi:hypothetical protein